MQARRHATAIALLVATTTVAWAAPKAPAARKEFDRGVAAYTKGDYATASDSFAKSFAIEVDVETLFAWAQTERKLGHCDKAIHLYTDLLGMNIPAENKKAIKIQIDECNQILAEERAAASMLDPGADPAPTATQPPSSEPGRSPTTADTTDADSGSASDASAGAASATDTSGDASAADTSRRETSAWYADPVGGALVGLGVAGLALGTVFFIQGSSADSDKATAATYDEYQSLSDRAESRGRLGLISLVAGGALVTAGVIRYATRPTSSESRTISGWLSPTTAGVTLSSRF